jgi:hypothetical protein
VPEPDLLLPPPSLRDWLLLLELGHPPFTGQAIDKSAQ